jgi:hypothetical protein
MSESQKSTEKGHIHQLYQCQEAPAVTSSLRSLPISSLSNNFSAPRQRWIQAPMSSRSQLHVHNPYRAFASCVRGNLALAFCTVGLRSSRRVCHNLMLHHKRQVQSYIIVSVLHKILHRDETAFCRKLCSPCTRLLLPRLGHGDSASARFWPGTVLNPLNRYQRRP